jgi:hypothetical protein
VRPPVGTTYLVHFDRPLGNPRNPRAMAQHYVGWSEDEQARLERHQNGDGAKIMAAAFAAGIECHVVRTWPRTTRATERKIKDRHSARDFCPVCSPRPGDVKPARRAR